MGLSPKVDSDYKTALKARDEETVSCLRLVRAALQRQQKDLGRPLEDNEEIAVLTTLAKQRREAAEQFTKGGRQDLADKELRELETIQGYLPAQMDEQEIDRELDAVIAEIQPQGPKDMGKVMKAAMARLTGKADGKLVNQMVRRKLGA